MASLGVATIPGVAVLGIAVLGIGTVGLSTLVVVPDCMVAIEVADVAPAVDVPEIIQP